MAVAVVVTVSDSVGPTTGNRVPAEPAADRVPPAQVPVVTPALLLCGALTPKPDTWNFLELD